MITGGARIVLLLVGLGVAATSSSSSICERTAFSIMSEMDTCTEDFMQNMPSLRPIAEAATPSVSDLLTFVQAYCTQAIPAGLTCFQDKISECNATLRAKFSQLAEDGVGIMCLPGGRGPDPVSLAFLGATSDEELRSLSSSGGCASAENKCYQQMANLTDPTSFPVDQVVEWNRETAAMILNCMAAHYRGMKDTCPQWRAAFMVNVRFLFTWPALGLRMPFTVEELTEKLEL